MQRKLHAVTFSPTGTSKAVALKIIEGIGAETAQIYDITRPEERKENNLSVKKDDLIIFAVPTYAGQLPPLAREWLEKMPPNPGTPAVCVVLYGNREYEDSLLELHNIVVERGYKPVAAAAFIGEHSFSSKALPIAHSRPHSDDLDIGFKFGLDIAAHFEDKKWIANIGELKVPGNFPYKDVTLPKGDFISVSDACVNCGVCARGCPAEAIDESNGFVTLSDKCIICCACIKSCPQNARKLNSGPIMDIAIKLNKICYTPKQPEIYWPE